MENGNPALRIWKNKDAHAACASLVDLDDGLALRALEGDRVDLAHEREVLLLARRLYAGHHVLGRVGVRIRARVRVRVRVWGRVAVPVPSSFYYYHHHQPPPLPLPNLGRACALQLLAVELLRLDHVPRLGRALLLAPGEELGALAVAPAEARRDLDRAGLGLGFRVRVSVRVQG